MFTPDDLQQIKDRGSDLASVQEQIKNFDQGFPFLNLEKAATPAAGIRVIDSQAISDLSTLYDNAAADKKIVKFVPASGAASRMFKLLFNFLELAGDPVQTEKEVGASSDMQSIGYFFAHIQDFAFASSLEIELKKHKKSIQSCLQQKDYSSILTNLLLDDGMGYGSAPKGLLEFHSYPEGTRTPAAEHLAEGAKYACSAHRQVHIHFTVSPEHRQAFEKHIRDLLPVFENAYKIKYVITFSEQHAYTDTIAVDPDNKPFRNGDGSLLFRPAGHGALIANLNNIDADIIFIKNIDNVVPDKLKANTITYKKVIAGSLMKTQEKIFSFLHLLDHGASPAAMAEMLTYMREDLNIKNIPIFHDDATREHFIRQKLNRPLRVCGMVKNEGEPGGGPFFAKNNDGTVSLQIVESSQIDFSDDLQTNIAGSATHFNPVDLVCGVKDYQGNAFDLTKFVDPQTGFISAKSKDGKPLRAQELPGLWNGAMSDWNTVFVEVPISTFNPVKTVNDLLRPQHQ